MIRKGFEVDIDTATFVGLSLPYQRKVAFWTTLVIWAGTAFFLYSLVSATTEKKMVNDIASIVSLVLMAHYILVGKFLLWSLAEYYFSMTPLAMLFTSDKRIIDAGRKELLRLSHRYAFSSFLEYAKINPSVRTKSALLVILHQQRGDLDKWTQAVPNLHKLADLVYQIYQVEEFLKRDEALAWGE
jgi:hypothetical protein